MRFPCTSQLSTSFTFVWLPFFLVTATKKRSATKKQTITSKPLRLSTFENQHHPFSQHKSHQNNWRIGTQLFISNSKSPPLKPYEFSSTSLFNLSQGHPLLLQHLDVFFILILQLGLKIFDTSIFGVNDLSTGTLLKLELIIQLLASFSNFDTRRAFFFETGGGGWSEEWHDVVVIRVGSLVLIEGRVAVENSDFFFNNG